MTLLANLPVINALADADLLYVRDASDAPSPDKRMTVAQLRLAAQDMTSATAVALADDDRIPVYDVNGTPAVRYTTPANLRPAGARITSHLRYAGTITIPTIAAGAEGSANLTVAGAAAGDHVLFNPAAAPAAGIGIQSVFISAANTVTAVFRNFSGSSVASATLSCVALVVRSTD